MNKLFLCAALSLVLAACGDQTKTDGSIDSDPSVTNNNQQGGVDGRSGAVSGTIDGGSVSGGSALAGGKLISYEKNAVLDSNNVLSGRIIYFAYDSNDVAEEHVELVKHHGKYLSFNPTAKLRLEGHADERGTREYNIALAERRAASVKALMQYEGADISQITVVSYGEEKPVSFSHDDESMQLNRRVEIVYE